LGGFDKLLDIAESIKKSQRDKSLAKVKPK
jgi:hypothetical protein